MVMTVSLAVYYSLWAIDGNDSEFGCILQLVGH